MTNEDIDNADIDNDFDADAETDTKTETETLKGDAILPEPRPGPHCAHQPRSSRSPGPPGGPGGVDFSDEPHRFA